MSRRPPVLLPLLLAFGPLLGCDDAACEENPGTVILGSITLTLGDEIVEAELADTTQTRERGWRKRRCDREVLALVPDPEIERPTLLPVWGCDLVDGIDVAFVRDGVVIETATVDACPLPCGDCPLIGLETEVDAVLELEPGRVRLEVGTRVEGLP